jgi:hypothetical protein
MLRVLTFKSFLACLVGLITPWLVILEYELIFGNADKIQLFIQPSYEKIFQFYNHTSISVTIIIILLFVFVLSLFSALNHYIKMKIYTRKQYQVFIFSGIYLTVLMAATGTSIELTPILAIPFSIIISHFIDNMKSWIWKNLILFSLIVSLILGQVFL